MILWHWRRLRSMSGDEVGLRVRRALRDRRDRARFERGGPEAVVGPAPDPGPWLEAPGDSPWLATAAELARRAAACPRPWQERARSEADANRAGRFRWLGRVHELGHRPQWRREAVSGVLFPARYWATLPHASPDGAFDYKHLWEPNLHESFVTLAKTHLTTGEPAYRDHLDLLWRDWMEQNPPLCGPNYLAPVEIGLRLAHWAAALRFRAARAPWPPDLLRDIWRHAHVQRAAIARNLSRGSSANNHLLGELASLVLADLAFPGLAPAAETADHERELWDQVLLQFAPDGGNREQAFHYHAFSLVFALLAHHAAARSGRPAPEPARARLRAAVDFLAAGLDARGRAFVYGDSDASEVLPLAEGDRDPYATVLALGRALFDAPFAPDERAFWLTGNPGDAGAPPADRPPEQRFPDTGHVFLRAGDLEAHVNGGELGYLSIAAHAHADALAVELRHAGRDVVIDPGTYTYRGGTGWRDALVAAAAHATTGPEGVEPAERLGPFLWGRRYPRCLRPAGGPGSPVTATLAFPGGAVVERAVSLTAGGARIEDRWSGPDTLRVRLTWPLGPGEAEVAGDGAVLRGPGFTARFTVNGLDGGPELRAGDVAAPGTPCRSPGYDVLEPGSALVWTAALRLPATVTTHIAVLPSG